MKLNEVAKPPTLPTPRGRQPFKALLEEARSPAAALDSARAERTGVPPGLAPKKSFSGVGARLAPPSVSKHAAEIAKTGRARVEAEAERLVSVRSQHDAVATTSEAVRSDVAASVEEKITSRVVDQIVRELLCELGTSSMTPSHSHHTNALTMNMTPAPVPGLTSSSAPLREAKAEQAVELIEKIEIFVRSQRPALQLTLNNSLGARVEIERVGPGQIALKLVGRDGPPSAEAVSRIREEMQVRGLRVAALSVA